MLRRCLKLRGKALAHPTFSDAIPYVATCDSVASHALSTYVNIRGQVTMKALVEKQPHQSVKRLGTLTRTMGHVAPSALFNTVCTSLVDAECYETAVSTLEAMHNEGYRGGIGPEWVNVVASTLEFNIGVLPEPLAPGDSVRTAGVQHVCNRILWKLWSLRRDFHLLDHPVLALSFAQCLSLVGAEDALEELLTEARQLHASEPVSWWDEINSAVVYGMRVAGCPEASLRLFDGVALDGQPTTQAYLYDSATAVGARETVKAAACEHLSAIELQLSGLAEFDEMMALVAQRTSEADDRVAALVAEAATTLEQCDRVSTWLKQCAASVVGPRTTAALSEALVSCDGAVERKLEVASVLWHSDDAGATIKPVALPTRRSSSVLVSLLLHCDALAGAAQVVLASIDEVSRQCVVDPSVIEKVFLRARSESMPHVCASLREIRVVCEAQRE